MGKKIEITKAVAGFVSGIGAGMIVGNIVVATTPYNTKLIQRVFIRTAGVFLSGAVGQFTSDYSEKAIDEIFTSSKQLKEEIERIEAEAEAEDKGTPEKEPTEEPAESNG
jgi:hypothetical protein